MSSDAAAAGVDDPIRVSSTSELLAALDATAPRRIHIAHGEYTIARPITIPDDTALVGDGIMQFDALGLPTGFEPGTETILRAAAEFSGDLLELGDRVTMRGLVARGSAAAPPRGGNVVVVASRRANDRVDVEVGECEIDALGPTGFTETGPIGHGLAVLTRNPAPAAAHQGATLAVHVANSIIRARPESGALFANNFASRATIEMSVTASRIEGPLVASGGTNRPDRVTHATMRIDSTKNLYVTGEGSDTPAWMLFGASSSPHVASAAEGPSDNTLRLKSSGDRIEAAADGILAVAARRIAPMSGPLVNNLLELDLANLDLRTRADGAADVTFLGAQVESPDGDASVGANNRLRIRMQAVRGSGMRSNAYGAMRLRAAPNGARLEIVGDPDAFARDNTGVAPPPPPDAFVGARE